MTPAVRTHLIFLPAAMALALAGCNVDRDLGGPGDADGDAGDEDGATSIAPAPQGGGRLPPSSDEGGGNASTTAGPATGGTTAGTVEFTCNDTIDCIMACTLTAADDRGPVFDDIVPCTIECGASEVEEAIDAFELIECVTAQCQMSGACQPSGGTGGATGAGSDGSGDTGPSDDLQCATCILLGLDGESWRPGGACYDEAIACE